MAYSLTGENIHYGTPLNPKDPRRIPGGSSNGSASAVATELVDFAVGTDCGGSVRLPASYCGILGIRPSLGRICLDGVIPFSASFDVVGWFARDAATLARIGGVLFDEPRPARNAARILIAEDALGFVDPSVSEALQPAVERLADHVESCERIRICDDRLEDWFAVFRVIQASEIWANHGLWIEENDPTLGPGVRERMDWARKVTPDEVVSARGRHEEIRRRLNERLGDNDVLCVPTSPRIAPLKGTPTDDVEVRFRHQAMCILCVSGLGGLPQVSLPLAELDGMPLGLSLIARHGNDEMLLDLAEAILE
jgi:amidase